MTTQPIVIDPRFIAQHSKLGVIRANLCNYGYTRQAEALGKLAAHLGEERVYEFVRDAYTIPEIDEAIAELIASLPDCDYQDHPAWSDMVLRA